MSDFMKVDTSRLDQAAEGRTGEAGTEPPAGADVDAFQRAMRQGGMPDEMSGEIPDGVEERESRPPDKDASQDGERAEPDDDFPQTVSQMTNPLESLFAGRMGQAPASEQAPADGPDMGALAEKLVERILVSEPVEGKSELRLTLGKDVLPGTEIRLLRGADGLLSVRLETDNAASFQTLVGAQETLKAQLERIEKSGVRVEVVSERNGADAEDGDARRRSRGLFIEPDERA